jgi:hypothetical protein
MSNTLRTTLLAVLIGGVAVTLTACGASGTSATSFQNDGPDIEVVYEVTGTATGVDITMEGVSGTSQQSDVAVPLTNQSGKPGLHLSKKSGDFLYISAQNNDDTGSVTCTIKADGKVISTVTSNGAYTIATCSGRA